VVAWGKTSRGRQRFFCQECRKTFSWRIPHNRDLRQLNIFKSWLSGVTINNLSLRYHKHPNTLRKIVRHFLINYPSQPRPLENQHCNMVIDTTWFGKTDCLTLYWDHNRQYLQYWRYGSAENSDSIVEDLLNLKEKGVVCASTTTDSSKIILKAIQTVYPDIPKQRCLVHLQREALNWLTRKPKDDPSQQLILLVNRLVLIRTKAESKVWLDDFSNWSNTWLDYLQRQRGNHYDYSQRSSRILRIASYLSRSLNGIFCHLDSNSIPWNTNGLEGRLSPLKQHYRQHRGLNTLLRKSYLSWYATYIINKNHI